MIDWKSIETQYWGFKNFAEVEALQQKAFTEVLNGHPGFLLGGELSFVVTQGLRGLGEEVLNSEIQPIKTDRGGSTTLHSPGQLVLYPIINLKKNQTSVREFITQILNVSQKTLLSVGVSSEMNLSPVGLWTEKGKIGFCGLRVKNGVTQHGLALNVSNDLTLFSQIHSCGIKQGRYDRAYDGKSDLNPFGVYKSWVKTSQN